MNGIEGVSTHRVPQRIETITARVEQLRATTNRPSAMPLGFGLILEQQRAGQLGTVAGVASSYRHAATQTSGPFGRLTPPPELAVYGNGQIPAEALEPIGIGNHRMWAPAAFALRELLADAAADGVSIGVTDTYRPLAVQERLAREKGLYRDGGLAAVPGTSNHGWGLSTDLDLDANALEWMRTNAWRYGFVEDVPREPWHWTYRPG